MTMAVPLILVVEDQPALQRALQINLHARRLGSALCRVPHHG